MAAELIKNLYLFKEFNQSETSQLNRIVKSQIYNPGDEIFSQGDSATSICMIKLGTVKIQQKSKGDEVINVATLGTGSHFGEMSFLDGEPRSATAIAVEKTEVVSIDYAELRTILNENLETSLKFYKGLSIFLGGRLRVTTLDLNFAREKNLRHF